MKTARRGNRKISTLKAAAGIVPAVAVLVIAQNLALDIAKVFHVTVEDLFEFVDDEKKK